MMASSPIVRDPITKPEIVMETAISGGIVEFLKVMTKKSEPGYATVDNAPPLISAVGMEFGEKKLEGKNRVMLSSADNSPPGDGANDNVAEQLVFAALRSLLDILKAGLPTRSPIAPVNVPK